MKAWWMPRSSGRIRPRYLSKTNWAREEPGTGGPAALGLVEGSDDPATEPPGTVQAGS